MEKVEEKIKTIYSNLEKGIIDVNIVMEIYFYLADSDDVSLKKYAAEELDEICNVIGMHEEASLFIYSCIINIYSDKIYMHKLFECIFSNKKFTWENKYYLYGRISRILFMNKDLCSLENGIMLQRLYEEALNDCINSMDYSIKRISEEDLNDDCQFVFTGQFLTAKHGPTKTALDRAIVIKKNYGKVLLVNTAEMLTEQGKVAFFPIGGANYNESLTDVSVLEWKGEEVGYYQCEKNMPNMNSIYEILKIIYEFKPRIVVAIGGESLLAGIINKIIPVLVVGCTQSSLTNPTFDYIIADTHQIEINKEFIDIIGCRERIIEGLFTFSLKDRTEFIERKDLGLDDDEFVISFVGGRIGDEISDEMLCMLNSINREFKIIFIGGYDKMDVLKNKYPELYNKAIDVGFCDDAMSRIEMSNLYVNPVRKGGGTSAVEAMSLGVPVATIDYGDVAGIVGPDFVCENIDELKKMIIKYMEDNEFYVNQSKKVLELSKILLDSEGEFARILDIYLAKRKNQNKN